LLLLAQGMQKTCPWETNLVVPVNWPQILIQDPTQHPCAQSEILEMKSITFFFFLRTQNTYIFYMIFILNINFIFRDIRAHH